MNTVTHQATSGKPVRNMVFLCVQCDHPYDNIINTNTAELVWLVVARLVVAVVVIIFRLTSALLFSFGLLTSFLSFRAVCVWASVVCVYIYMFVFICICVRERKHTLLLLPPPPRLLTLCAALVRRLCCCRAMQKSAPQPPRTNASPVQTAWVCVCVFSFFFVFLFLCYYYYYCFLTILLHYYYYYYYSHCSPFNNSRPEWRRSRQFTSHRWRVSLISFFNCRHRCTQPNHSQPSRFFSSLAADCLCSLLFASCCSRFPFFIIFLYNFFCNFFL